jgi:ubiquinone/menaquinone biosynthesis C-methylase UbiE
MGSVAFDPVAFHRFELAGWERKAHGYHITYAPIAGYVVDPLLDAARVGPASRTLDIGSGPGYVAARAAERGARVVGVDFSETMVRLARQLHPDLRFAVGDAQSVPFPASSFDAVWATSFCTTRQSKRAC